MTADPLVYLNGAMTPLSEAKIPVLDRGFIFGDGVYEMIPLYQRQLFRPTQHMARLFRSLEAVGIANAYTLTQWLALIDAVVNADPAQDQLVYLQVTRGVAPRAHAFPADTVPTVFIMTRPLTLPSPELRATGASCVSMEDQRWLRCDIKSTSLLGNVLAAQFAVEHDAQETIQFRDDMLTEGSASNIWIVKDGCLLAPPRDHHILEGVRYGLLEEFCTALEIPFVARPIQRQEVFDADEVLLSSAGKEILAVTSIDGRPIGNGQPGPVLHRLYAAYQNAKKIS